MKSSMKVRVTKSYKVAYIAIQDVLNKKKIKNLKYMITIWTKWELHKTRSFGSKTQGTNFAMHSEFRYHREISL